MDRMAKPGSGDFKSMRGSKIDGRDPLGANGEIARKLKQYYDELVTEQIPDRFADLLSQLEQAERPAAKD
jgi:Anti-sigma factor NepR